MRHLIVLSNKLNVRVWCGQQAKAIIKMDLSSTKLKKQTSVGHTAVCKMNTEVGISPHHLIVFDDKAVLQKALGNSPDLIAHSVKSRDNHGRTLLMYAILGNNSSNVKLLIKFGADVNAVDNLGDTALHWAILKNQIENVKILLAKGGNWKIQNHEGATALHLASKKKSCKCLSVILRHVALGEVDIQDKSNRTALHWAAACGSIDNVRLLVKASSSIGIPDVEGKIPLHWAAECSTDSAVDIISTLLAKMSTAISWSDYKGRSPLHLAVSNGKLPAIVKLVSSEGCNINEIDNMGQTPLHWAAVKGYTDIVKFLCGHGADPERGDASGGTPLHYAGEKNFPDTIAALCPSPQLVSKQDMDGHSTLFWAVCQGAFDAVEMLVKFNADLEQADKNGATVLHAAAVLGNLQMTELLLNLEASVDPKDNCGMTPLMCACEASHADVVRLLIKAGADIMHVDFDRRSSLHWAAIGRHRDVCIALIESGVDADVRDSVGQTPLHLAALEDNLDCAWALIQCGAQCDEQDNEGNTALHLACRNGNIGVIKLLVNYSSNINKMRSTLDRYTALNIALVSSRNSDAVHYLIDHGALPIEHIREIAAHKIQTCFRAYRIRKSNLARERDLMIRGAHGAFPKNANFLAGSELFTEMDFHKGTKIVTKKRYKKKSQRKMMSDKKLQRSVSVEENLHMLTISPDVKTIKQKTKRFQSPSAKSDCSFTTGENLGTSFELSDDGNKKGDRLFGAISKRNPGLFDKSKLKYLLKKGKKSTGKEERVLDDDTDRFAASVPCNTQENEQRLEKLKEEWLYGLENAVCLKNPQHRNSVT